MTDKAQGPDAAVVERVSRIIRNKRNTDDYWCGLQMDKDRKTAKAALAALDIGDKLGRGLSVHAKQNTLNIIHDAERQAADRERGRCATAAENADVRGPNYITTYQYWLGRKDAAAAITALSPEERSGDEG